MVSPQAARVALALCLWVSTAVPVATAASLPFYDARDLTPYWSSDHQPELSNVEHRPTVLPTFSLLNQDGKPVTEAHLTGKITVVNFFFRSCGSVCPMMTSVLQHLQRTLHTSGTAPHLAIVSFSIEPEQDPPVALKHYASEHHLDLQDWSLLTGERAQIYTLGRRVFKDDKAIRAPNNDTGFVHSSHTYLLDAQRRLRGVYDTQSAEQMHLLEQDIAALEQELGGHKS